MSPQQEEYQANTHCHKARQTVTNRAYWEWQNYRLEERGLDRAGGGQWLTAQRGQCRTNAHKQKMRWLDKKKQEKQAAAGVWGNINVSFGGVLKEHTDLLQTWNEFPCTSVPACTQRYMQATLYINNHLQVGWKHQAGNEGRTDWECLC